MITKEHQAPGREPIAIVGVACRFPGSPDIDSFWRTLASGRDVIGDYQEKRGPALDSVLTRASVEQGTIASLRGGFLPGIDLFDADFFGISPREALSLDPQQRLLLELSWEALESAGIVPERIRGSRTGVFATIWTSDYEQCLYETQRDIELYATTGCGRYAASGRISYAFDFRGPTLTVDTACSSSLVAVNLACRSLTQGDCDLALVGAANLIVRPEISQAYSRAKILSPDGTCKFGDEAANGYVRGEGGAVVVLKRLQQALQDADPIHALVLGGSITHHGSGSGLLVRPAQGGLEAMLREAWRDAGIKADDIGYLEAHGAGTRAGDPVEIGAMHQVLAEGGRTTPCLVGSVKTNIGHLEAASGLSGLLKTILALRHRKIPATLHFNCPNPEIAWDQIGIRIPGELTPWPAISGPARAGVSSFGITGTTSHVVLQEAPSATLHPETDQESAAAHLLPLSARTPGALRALVEAYLDGPLAGESRLADVCYTASVRRTHHRHRASFVATDVARMREELAAFAAGEERPRTSKGRAAEGPAPRVAFVFPGQGSQWTGMGRELLRREPVFRDALQPCDAAIQKLAGWSLVKLLQAEGSPELERIDRIQPLLFGMQVALFEMWRSWGVTPGAVVGHSMGEVAAAYAAGALTLEDAASVIVARSRLMREVSGRGGMAVLGVSIADAESFLAGYGDRVVVAASNSPLSTVVSGDREAIAELVREVGKTDIFCRAIKVDVASHSRQMDPLAGRLGAELAGLHPLPMSVPFFSTVTGRREDGALGADYWAQNLRRPVLFSQAIHSLIATEGVWFIEVSPHPLLTTALEETTSAAGVKAVALGSLRREEPEVEQLLSSLGRLYTAGYPVDWSKLHSCGNHVSLPNYPWQRERFWFDTDAAPRSVKLNGSSSNEATLGEHLEIASRPGLHIWRIHVPQSVPTPFSYRVGGEARLPRSIAFRLILEAAAKALSASRLALTDVDCAAEINLREGAEAQLSIEVLDATEVTFDLQIRQGVKWESSMRGSLKPSPMEQAAEREPIAREDLEPCSFYAEAADLGVEYGPALQWLEKVEDGQQGSIAAVKPGCSQPALWEAMLQSVSLVAGKIFCLQSIGQAWVAKDSPCEGLLLESRAISGDPVTCDEWSADVVLRTTSGELVGELRGIQLTLVEEQPTLKVADCVYEEEWTPAPCATANEAPARDWIVLGDPNDGVQSDFVRRLISRGERAQSVCDLGESVLANLKTPLAGVVVMLGGTESEGGSGPMEARVERSVMRAVAAVQKLLLLQTAEAPQLWIVTRGAESIPGFPMEALGLEHGAVRGLARVMGKEHPELRCVNVDLATSPGGADLEAAIDSLLRGDVEDQAAFRDGRRYVCRLRRAPWERAETDWPVRRDATYLITGGLGGLGIELAKRLAEGGAGRLVLIGRSGPRARAMGAIRGMEALGTRVTIGRCDVADRKQLERLLDDVERDGPPLAGIIHAAAVIDDVLGRDLTDESISRVFAPKVAGAWHLHELTAGRKLDFFVLFSSITALLPQPGQGSYAAANAFLDTLACWRREQGLPAVALRWAVWTATGIWNEGLRRTAQAYRTQGVYRLPSRIGYAALQGALHSSAARVMVAPVDWARAARFHAGDQAPSLVRDLLPQTAEPAADAGIKEADLRDRIGHAEPADREQVIETHLRQTLGAVLRIGPDRIDSSRPVGQHGLDSLMGLEFVRRLSADLGMRLPSSLVYNYPTISQMVTHLSRRLGPATQSISESPALAPRSVAVEIAIPAVSLGSDEDALAELMGAQNGEAN